MAFFSKHSDPSASGAEGLLWSRQSGEFARRLDAHDLQGVLRRSVNVDTGTRGLLFQNGAYQGDLPPGRHTVESVAQRIKNLILGSPVSVLIVDDGESRLRLEAKLLLTSEDQDVSATVILVVALADPLKLCVNMMRGKQVLTIEDVCRHLHPIVLTAVTHVVRGTSIRALAYPVEIGECLEDVIRERSADSFAAAGLRFVRLEAASFRTPHDEEISRVRGRLSLREAQFDLERRQRDLERQIEAEATRDRLAKIESEAELREFLQRDAFDARTSDLARELQWQRIYDDFVRAKDDLEAQREQLRHTRRQQDELERAALKYEYELAELRGRQSLDRATEDFEREQARRRFEDELTRRGVLFQRTLDERRSEARSASEVADIERERIRRDAELRLAKQKAKAAFAIELLERTQWIEQESRQFDLDLRQGERQAESIRLQAEKDAEHRRELERLAALDRVRTETLVAVSGGAQSAQLVELLKLEAYKGLSPEQILMIKAAESPAAAAALTEKFRADATVAAAGQATERALYERLLQEARTGRTEIKDALTGAIGEIQQASAWAIQSQHDVAMAAVDSSMEPSAPLTSPSSSKAPGAACRACGEPMNADDKFCGACGKSRLGF